MLFDPAGEAYQVSTGVALAFAITLALLFGLAAAKIVKVRRTRPQTGQEDLLGQEGVVRRSLDPDRLRPRPRRALAGPARRGSPIPAGEHVEVTGIDDDLVLEVRPAERPAPVEA